MSDPRKNNIFEWFLILVLIIVLTIVVLALIGPAIGNIFHNLYG